MVLVPGGSEGSADSIVAGGCDESVTAGSDEDVAVASVVSSSLLLLLLLLLPLLMSSSLWRTGAGEGAFVAVIAVESGESRCVDGASDIGRASGLSIFSASSCWDCELESWIGIGVPALEAMVKGEAEILEHQQSNRWKV